MRHSFAGSVGGRMSEDRTELEEVLQRILLERYSPTGFLVDSDLNIVCLLGDASSYVQLLPGKPSFNLVKLVHRPLLPHLQAAIDASSRAADSGRQVVEVEDRGLKTIIEATPISTSTHRVGGFLILLRREQVSPEMRRSQDEWSRLRRETELMRNSVTSASELRHELGLELQGVRAELDKARDDLKRAVGQLIRAHEEEHKSVARELHDVFSQKLATLGLELDALTVQAKDVSAKFADTVAGVKSEIVDFGQQLHQLSRRLHPAMIRQTGLRAAVRDECARWSAHHKIALECETENLPDSVPEEINLALFRVAQEALNNIAKHARTSRARLRLSADAGNIRLVVEDFGQGFDVRKNITGLGLITMEERIRNANGRFRIRSNPGQGTAVEAEVPL